jgi:hypothetical protein
MKTLSIKEQIEVLKELLRTWDIWCMCVILYHILKERHGMQPCEDISDYIPSFTHSNYIKFHIKAKAVRKRVEDIYWDSPTIFGNLRRRWFVRHLIKELKKQL